jgi:CheY-like chemotaxis protein
MRYLPTPIVALTASADVETVKRTKEAGCNLHIGKPLKKATLLETINRYARPMPTGTSTALLSHQVA